MTQTPAGWYPTPNGQRYWDGQAWTEHYAPAPPQLQPPNPRLRWPWYVGGAAVGFVLLVGCIGAIAGSDTDTTASDPESAATSSAPAPSESPTEKAESKPDPNDPDLVGDEIGAETICRQFVEDRLRSPSSADFGDAEAKQVDGPVWVVVGEVDSENSFGAAIRNRFACQVRFLGDDEWRLKSMAGLGN